MLIEIERDVQHVSNCKKILVISSARGKRRLSCSAAPESSCKKGKEMICINPTIPEFKDHLHRICFEPKNFFTQLNQGVEFKSEKFNYFWHLESFNERISLTVSLPRRGW